MKCIWNLGNVFVEYVDIILYFTDGIYFVVKISVPQDFKK